MTDRECAFGRLLSRHRQRVGMSQLALSLEADISSRHLSFLEVGRSSPSQAMVARLAKTLNLSVDEHDGLLLAAGFAPLRLRREGMAAISIQAASVDLERVYNVCGDGLCPERQRRIGACVHLFRNYRYPSLYDWNDQACRQSLDR